ncbi:MAG: CoA-binding protein [Syntrophales bacterium]|jgi:acyl-CoA synthetase (NDP forming)|nr:CoA-binding protein [Syntrophales bacterium]MDY0043831.1 CoA-binding protein [Syntrophales bacterium]
MPFPSLPDAFFRPRNIAVIGATKKAGFGGGIPAFLKRNGYGERLFLVNPRETEIEGLPVYRRLTDITGNIDCAIIIVPKMQVPAIMKDCLDKGVRAVILETAGFSETGDEGRTLENDIKELIQGTHTRVIGPNCVGLINPHDRFGSTEVDFDEIRPGNIGVIAQSGVFGNIVADWSPSQDMALSALVTIGNRIDVDESDMLYHFGADTKTDVIVLYLEGAKDGMRFMKAAREVARVKPVIILKSGRTEMGKKAAASHTGSMSGDDALYEAFFRQSGVVRASNFQELFDLARVFSREPLMEGPDISVVTSSGSLAVMAADAAHQLGLGFPDLGQETVEAVRSRAPAWMNVKNPLDVGPSGLFGTALKAALNDEKIKGVLAIPVIPGTIIKSMVESGMDPALLYGDPESIRKTAPGKPALVYSVGSEFWTKLVKDMFGPHFTLISSPDTAAKAFFALYKYRQFREKIKNEQ